MGWLIDTSLWIAVERGTLAAADIHAITRREPIYLRITVETGDMFGVLSAKLRTSGRDPHVRVNDLWLAAQAIQHELQLLTSNARDFADIPGLRMVVLKSPESEVLARLRRRSTRSNPRRAIVRN